MKFYNREEELKFLEKIISSKKSEFCYFLWRRRIGKTSLIKYFFRKNNKNYIYFFVWNKSEWNLLENFSETLKNYLWFEIKFSSLREFLKFIFDYSKKQSELWNNLNIVFDEFQNFQFVNKEIFSDFQEFWDKNKDKTKINIFAIWSIFTLMEKVFQDKGSPLFWRATAKIFIDEFEINILSEILKDYKKFSYQNLLDVYTFFWWVPKYLEIFDEINWEIDWKWNLLENILNNHYICKNSLLLNEWRDLLISEFWKTSQINFSILEAIANWKIKRSEIADYTKINYDSLWLYLEKLEKFYKYIEKVNSIIEQKTKINKYKIKDNFLTFRFRYIYKKSNLIEIWKYSELIDFVKQDIKVLQWFVFEKLMKKLIIQKNIENKFLINFEKIWNYFDRTWKNEIDLIAFNEKTKEVVFIECKLNKEKIDKKIKLWLIEKSETIKKFEKYKKHYLYLSLNDIQDYI